MHLGPFTFWNCLTCAERDKFEAEHGPLHIKLPPLPAGMRANVALRLCEARLTETAKSLEHAEAMGWDKGEIRRLRAIADLWEERVDRLQREPGRDKTPKF
ncbi:MAG: hypothetical protein ACYTKD_29645 [Planctomycetota bacterium]|jgi:hypothetical protein